VGGFAIEALNHINPKYFHPRGRGLTTARMTEMREETKLFNATLLTIKGGGEEGKGK